MTNSQEQGSLADRIRRFAFDTYVVPASGSSGAEIRIRAGDVHKAMRLSGRMPAVCAALKSLIFRREFGLELLGRSGPPLGANVEFVFRDVGEGRLSAQPDSAKLNLQPIAEVQPAVRAQEPIPKPELSRATPLSSAAGAKLSFTLRGRTFEKERNEFTAAVLQKIPGRIQKYSTQINGTRYPIRQVVSLVTGLPPIAITSQDAYRILEKFGFRIETYE